MDTSLFDYTFPKELVAQHPPANREEARMMVLNRAQQTSTQQKIPDLLDYLRPGDVLILNNALADLVPFEDKLVPALPPYIKRKKVTDFTPEDFVRYRTVYGQVPGSKAAPTAGFHFSESLLEKIKTLGVNIQYVTLHVSYDTYKPIRAERIEEHPMHGEQFEISEETARAVRKAKEEGRRVIAVGTTTVRVLESWAPVGAQFIAPGGVMNHAPTRTTNLFIQPGFKFKIVDALLTNFHRPKSTVLVMVSAFAGREFILASYQEAIQEKYRLFSYGDCMLIL